MRYLTIPLFVVCAAAPAQAQTPADWKLVPVASVGGADATDERLTFDLVPAHGLAALANGNVLVLDVRGKRVVEYNAAGRHVRTLGRGGEGPGEFQFPYGIGVGPGDSVWVSDVGRFTVFAPSGRHRTFATNVRTFGQLRVGTAGIVQALNATPNTAGGAGGFYPDHVRLAQFNARGSVRDTLWTGPYPRRIPVTVQIGKSSSSTSAVEQYATSTHWDMLSDGTLVVSDTSAYLLRLVSPAGRQIATLGTREAARRTSAADRARALARLEAEQKARQASQRNERFQTPAELWKKQRDATPFAAFVPRVSAVRVDAKDRIWVGISGEQTDLERIDVYDRSGKLVARVANPPAMPAAFMGDDLAAFVTKDEFDAQVLRIVRIQ